MSYAILIIEDEAILAKKIAKYLTQRGYETQVAGTGPDGLAALATFRPEAVLLDYNLPGGLNGLEVLKRIIAHDANIKVIMFTGEGNIPLAVEAIKAGAFDYLSKPIMLSGLKIVLDRAIGEDRREIQLTYFRSKARGDIEHIIGASEGIKTVKSQIARIIDAGKRITSGTPPAVLITGETGTGKELVARALHFDGPRSKDPFIEVNVATIPAHLVESELFGYERGAFTGATERKIGLVEAASGGTLFLDEIGELDQAIQAKLLKLFENFELRRLGSIRSKRVNLQIVCATNRNLEEMVAQGKFREDLYFRLNTFTLPIPPLRGREGDIFVLASHFVSLFNRKYNKSELRFSDSLKDVLEEYYWPGNVRELRNMIEQAVLLCDGKELLEKHFCFPKNEWQKNDHTQFPANYQNRRAGYPPPRSDANQVVSDPALGGTLEEVERDLIEKTLRDVDGNVSKGARLLGISRDQLRYRIEKYHIHSKA
ncbi:MAG: sigma-54 dependent transcriptional regulator [Desulforhopalus sp.]